MPTTRTPNQANGRENEARMTELRGGLRASMRPSLLLRSARSSGFTELSHSMPVRRLLHGVLLCVLALGAWSMVAPAQAPIPVHSADPGRRPSRVVLTWRDDPARTQAVTWRTDALVEEAFAEIVEASANPGSTALARRSPARTTAVPVPAGTAYYHEARFTALRPDTQYAYRVGDGATWSEWFHFRTASVEPAAFSFIYLGDAEADVGSLWSRAIRAAFVDAPRARFVLHAGDLVNVGESDDQWGEWFGAGGWINGTVPQVPVVGNHEYGRVNREDPAPAHRALAATVLPARRRS